MYLARAASVENLVPVCEYEPEGRECFASARAAWRPSKGWPRSPCSRHCPWCGLDVRRKISRATFKLSSGGAEAAARKGFYVASPQQGTWEKVAGSGVDAIVGASGDVAAVEAEKRPPMLGSGQGTLGPMPKDSSNPHMTFMA